MNVECVSTRNFQSSLVFTSTRPSARDAELCYRGRGRACHRVFSWLSADRSRVRSSYASAAYELGTLPVVRMLKLLRSPLTRSIAVHHVRDVAAFSPYLPQFVDVTSTVDKVKELILEF
jgi:hypothetical protein